MSDLLRERVAAAIGDQYAVEGEIGRGGMSVVYCARDRRLDRTVAIKVLPPELAHDPAVRTRFAREAHTAAQLAHPHIVPIHDVGERENIAYLVMTYVTGGNLAAMLADEPRQSITEVRRLLIEIADALSYAHLRGVIHRDIKPDNILLDGESGRAMVTDFGIARALEAGTRLTVTGVAVGTPAYMSPEQAVGERAVDGRSDIYSLGVLAYQMLTGRLPFSAGNSMALLMKHVSEQPRPIGELRPDAPRALREVIERALMKAPEERWPTAAALRNALLADRGAGTAWRAEHRETVRYTSPRPDGGRGEVRAVSPRRGGAAPDGRAGTAERAPDPAAIESEPPHLTVLTPEQRRDIRLWHGRIPLMDRIKTARRYAFSTVVAIGLSIAGVVVGAEEEMFPLLLAPIVPMYMSVKLWYRGRSLRESGLRLRRVFLMPRARWVLPTPAAAASERELEKLAPRELLDGPYGSAIRRAVDDRTAILAIARSLSKPDRALLSDLEPTVKGLVERLVHLVQTLRRLQQSIDPRQRDELDARIVEVEREGRSGDGERRLTLLRRQRATLDELIEHQAALARQIDSVGLALGNLRLDLVKLRSSGLQSALSDVSTATQEARALSREIGAALEAAAEVKSL